MSFFSRCWGRFRGGFGPVNHSGFEVFLMRLFFAATVFYALPDRGDVGGLTGQKNPVGLAHFMDLTWIGKYVEPIRVGWLAEPLPFSVLSGILAVALLFYVVGRFVWLGLPVATVIFCGVAALWNSQGVARHTVQIVGLVLFVQSVYYVACQVRLWRGSKSVAGRSDQHRIAVWFAQQSIVATYVITAITKVVNSGGMWVKDSKYYPLQIEKTRLSDFYNHLGAEDGKVPGGGISAGLWERAVGMLDGLSVVIQDYLIANPNMCRLFLATGLALEFFAFMALRGRLALFLYGVALIGFHLTIGRVMELHFTVHNLVILVFMVNIPFIFYLLWRRVSGGSDHTPGGGIEAAPLERADAETGS